MATWAVKDYVQVGTTTTSSWLGMNLARSVLYRAPAGQIAALQRQGRMSAIASVPPFAGPEVYSPRYVRAVPSPIAAVGDLHKANGSTNFNNPLYIAVSSRYLHDDLVWIRAHPGAYADDVANSVGVWMVGTDQNFTDSVNWPPRADLRPRSTTGSSSGSRCRTPPPGSSCSPAAGTARPGCRGRRWPSTHWRGSGPRCWPGAGAGATRRWPATLAVLWWTTAYAFVTTSLIEIGENERFRSELGPVPTVLAVVVVTAAVRAPCGGGGAGAAGGEPGPAATGPRPADPSPRSGRERRREGVPWSPSSTHEACGTCRRELRVAAAPAPTLLVRTGDPVPRQRDPSTGTHP